MRIVLTSDTHVPARARDLPAPLWPAIDAADLVVHAGDWVNEDLLDRFEARAARLIAVYGNNDGPALRARLPEIARAEIDGVRLAVVHETGPARADARRGVPPASPTGRAWCSVTHTSRGTPWRAPGCACSTPAHPPTAAVSPTRRT